MQNMLIKTVVKGKVPVQDDARPRPPYLSTIMQLGLGKQASSSYIPSLLDALGGAGMPALSRHWMHSLLLMPPAHEHALLLQTAVAHYCTCDQVCVYVCASACTQTNCVFCALLLGFSNPRLWQHAKSAMA
eukprot:1159364-Pelagomonas_calceolata.AAC.2